MVGMGNKILFIEDDPEAAKLYAKKLEIEGYNVVFVYSGSEGIVKAKELLPNLILLDLMMPGIDGFEVLRSLKADPKTTDIPIIVLTNLEGANAMQKATELGAKEYLIKSDNAPSDVTVHVGNVLAGK